MSRPDVTISVVVAFALVAPVVVVGLAAAAGVNHGAALSRNQWQRCSEACHPNAPQLVSGECFCQAQLVRPRTTE